MPTWLQAVIAGGGGLMLVALIAAGVVSWYALQNRRLATDLQACRAAGQANEASRIELEAMLDNSLTGICYVRDRRFVRVNHGFEKMFGYARGEPIGQSTRILYASDADHDAAVVDYAVLAAGDVFTADVKLVRKDGTPIWCADHGKALDPSDLGKGTVWASLDITRRKETEEALRASEAFLEQANREMAVARQNIDDSIEYASLIQRAILPNHQLARAFGARQAVLWLPRDVVGGDFYVYRDGPHGPLLGVVDCAGHGVPGAMMTMLAHAAIDQAITDVGMDSPAAILDRTDQIIRTMLRDDPHQRALATTMDVGLACVNTGARELSFAGAKIGLSIHENDEVRTARGANRAIGDRRLGKYADTRIALRAGQTFYLTTDGFLDQAGGEWGFSFGAGRFTDMIRSHAGQSLAEQSQAFDATLKTWQDQRPQRDDVTVLCFCFE